MSTRDERSPVIQMLAPLFIREAVRGQMRTNKLLSSRSPRTQGWVVMCITDPLMEGSSVVVLKSSWSEGRSDVVTGGSEKAVGGGGEP